MNIIEIVQYFCRFNGIGMISNMVFCPFELYFVHCPDRVG